MATTSETSSTASDKKDETDNSDENYELCKPLLNTGIEIEGARVQYFPGTGDPVTHVKNLRALKLRHDDVFIVAFPKCGTHWIWEVTQMLLNRSAQYEKRTKEHVMLEFCPISILDAAPSPRIFNSHLWMSHLPLEIITKKTKIIHIVRNPKDALVSLFFHLNQVPFTKINFEQLLKVYMDNKILYFQHQFNYLRQMKQFEKDHSDVPIKLIYYEDMKRDPVKAVKELAEFLTVPASEAFCEQITLACSFENMKEMDVSREVPEQLKKVALSDDDPKVQIYRKGVIGDWKNHFTVAQNERFNDFITRETAKGLDYIFIYE